MAKTVLVTGAAGRLGSQIASRLVASGQFRNVFGTDISSSLSFAETDVNVAPSFEFIGGVDLEDQTAVSKLFKDMGTGVSLVVHAAAFPGPSRVPPPGVIPNQISPTGNGIGLEDANPSDLLRANVISTYNVFAAAMASGALQRVVFSSSAFACGWSHDPRMSIPRYLPIDELHPPLPYETYGLSKVMGEKTAEMFARIGAASFVSLRFTNIIKREQWGTLPWKEPVPVAVDSCEGGTGSLTLPMWSYVHEDDVIEAHLRAAELELPLAPTAPVQAQPLAGLQTEEPNHVSLLLAAPETRFEADTEHLLRRHWGDTRNEAVARPQGPLKGNTSPICGAKASEVLGFKYRSWQSSQPVGSGHQQRRSFSSVSTVSSFRCGDVTLSNGRILEDAELVYEVHGKPNETNSNLVLHPTSFGATHDDLGYRIGPGSEYTLDTDKYCVVVVNMLANGVSSSPYRGYGECYKRISGLSHWPYPSIYDNVLLQARLLEDVFGLSVIGSSDGHTGSSPLALVFGYSMGAMQAYQFAALYPNAVQRLAVVCGAARTSPYNKVFLKSLMTALKTDAHWLEEEERFTGHPMRGLKAFGTIYAGWGLSEEFYRNEEFKQHGSFESLNHFLDDYVDGFTDLDPHNLLAMLATWYGFELALPSEGCYGWPALGAVTSDTLLMPCSSDRYFPVTDSEQELKHLTSARSARLRPIPSTWGHRAGDPHRQGQEAQATFIRNKVHALLKDEDLRDHLGGHLVK